MKDEVYNRFKRELSKLHKQGYEMSFPNAEEHYDEDLEEHFFYFELGMFKTIKTKPDTAL